jgi:hypothetical protein
MQYRYRQKLTVGPPYHSLAKYGPVAQAGRALDWVTSSKVARFESRQVHHIFFLVLLPGTPALPLHDHIILTLEPWLLRKLPWRLGKLPLGLSLCPSRFANTGNRLGNQIQLRPFQILMDRQKNETLVQEISFRKLLRRNPRIPHAKPGDRGNPEGA